VLKCVKKREDIHKCGKSSLFLSKARESRVYNCLISYFATLPGNRLLDNKILNID